MDPNLRKWQNEAMEEYRKKNKSDFSVSVTPGGGKTTFALALTEKLLSVKQINTVVVVVPTDHLRTQWSDNAIERGIFLDPSLSNKSKLIPDEYDGYVATYAQIALNPALHRARTVGNKKKTLVIFDELHHAGDGLSWGDALKLAFGDTSRRLGLTGTPFRTGSEIIPFIDYETDSDGFTYSRSDYSYGYKDALEDKIVRPVSFASYSGESTWSNSAGEVLSARMGDMSLSKDLEKGAWKTALNPRGAWIKHVIKAADDRLTEIREAGMKNAGAMILASDKETARKYAKIVEDISGTKPVVILSDDRNASKNITKFSESTDPKDRWMVAVKMVSEGVDVPRLAVGVWATTCKTPLFFAQAVGRFIRCKAKGETATIFLPAVKMLLELAANMEAERNHVIAPPEAEDESDELIDPMMEEENEGEGEDDVERGKHEALSAEARFDHVLFNGKAFDGKPLSPDEIDLIGIPGILDPTAIAHLLHQRDEDIRKSLGSRQEEEVVVQELNPFELEQQRREVRKEINRCVSRIALSRGLSHAQIHHRTRKAVPGLATAEVKDIETLNKRLEWLQSY